MGVRPVYDHRTIQLIAFSGNLDGQILLAKDDFRSFRVVLPYEERAIVTNMRAVDAQCEQSRQFVYRPTRPTGRGYSTSKISQ